MNKRILVVLARLFVTLTIIIRSSFSTISPRSYWVDSAKDIGLYDTELGIKRRTPPARAVQDLSFPSSGQRP